MEPTNTDAVERKQIESLPAFLRDDILSGEWEDRFAECEPLLGITSEQGDKLYTETYLVMTGFEKLSNFKSNVMKELGVGEASARAICDNVAEKVFAEVMDDINLINEAPAAGAKPEAPKAPPKADGLLMIDGKLGNAAPAGGGKPGAAPDPSQSGPQPKPAAPDPYREPIN